MEEEKKSCYNCGNFCQHYVVLDTTLQTINCGHCCARRITANKAQSFPFGDGCELWIKSAQPQKRKERIELKLREMAEQIRKIQMILESDWEENHKIR